MTTYFWSDTHFNHTKIVGTEGFCPRTRGHLTSVDEMNEWLIELWNGAVTKRDEVYLLGDFSWTAENVWGIFQALNGRKHLVTGNHDEKRGQIMHLPWETVNDLVTLKRDGMAVVACHYPLETWKNAQHDHLMLHGHSHGSLKRVIPHRFDVGVDAWGVDGPIAFEDIWERGQAQEFAPTDHHGD